MDAGKPETEFSSHWPKDTKGNTICPTLLDQECRFCHQKGHTVKYCKELAKKIAQDEREQRQQARAETAAKTATTSTTKSTAKVNQTPSRFALLMDEDSDDESTPAPAPTLAPAAHMKEEFPELGGNWSRVTSATPVAGVSFVAMACKPKEVAISEKQEREKDFQLAQGMVAIAKLQVEPKTEAQLVKQKHNYECFRGTNGKSWADMDSDDEDDAQPQQVQVANDAW